MYYGNLVRHRLAGPFVVTESAFPPASALPVHCHEAPYFTFTLRGTYRERYGRNSRVCTPGTIVAHPPFEEHAQDFGSDPALLIRIAVSETDCEIAADAALAEPIAVISPSIAKVMDRLHRELGSADPWTDVIVEGLAFSLVGSVLLRNCSKGGSRRRALCAQTLIRSSLRNSVSLSDVARQMGVSRATLYRDFGHAYGCTPGEYQRRLRVIAAAETLKKTRRPISEIAAEYGFYDQCHFARCFRQVWGVTPLRYRGVNR